MGNAQDLSLREKDSIKANKTSQLAFDLRDQNPDSSFLYATTALKISSKWNFKELIAFSLSDIGNYYKGQEEYDSARFYLKSSLDQRIQNQNVKNIASGYNNLALFFNHQEEYDSAEVYFLKGLFIARQSQLKSMEGKVLNGLGMSYLNRSYLDKAREALSKSIDIGLEQKDSSVLAKRFQNLGKVYKGIERYLTALSYFDKAEELYLKEDNTTGLVDVVINKGAILILTKEYEESIKVLKRAEKLSREHNLTDNQIDIWTNLAKAYCATGQEDLCDENYSLSIRHSKQKGKRKSMVASYIGWTYYLIDQKRNTKSLELLNKADAIVKEDSLIQFLPDLHILRAKVYKAKGEFKKSNEYYSKYLEIKSQLDQLIDNAQFSLAEKEMFRRDRRISEVERDLALADAEKQSAQNKVLIATIVAIVIFFLGITMYLFFRIRTTKLKTKAALEKKKSEEKVIDILNDVEVQLIKKKLETKKQVSHKIGQNIHDYVGSQLALVQISLGGIRSKIGELEKSVRDRMNMLDNLLDETCSEMRGIGETLMQKFPQSDSLEKELGDYLERIDSAIELKIRYIPRNVPMVLRDEIQMEIMAIARVLVSNVLKHAGATELSIFINGQVNQLQIIVEDNGKGFDIDKVPESDGNGLNNIRQRTEKIKAKFSIDSRKDKGTLVKLDIPLNNI